MRILPHRPNPPQNMALPEEPSIMEVRSDADRKHRNQATGNAFERNDQGIQGPNDQSEDSRHVL